MIKPMLACDWDESKVKFPVLMQPKIDGVRAMNFEGTLTGRSGKTHKNIATTNFFSQGAFKGLDGEMAAEEECHHALCRLTTSALNTIEGSPWLLWHVFDYITPETINQTYEWRHAALVKHVGEVNERVPDLGRHLKIVWHDRLHRLEDVNDMDSYHLDKGYEGSILRAPTGFYKQGRCTVREGGLLRIKRFVEEEFIILGIEEGQTNLNEAKLDLHGFTERSTHMANMVPNGMVGAFLGTDIKTKNPIKVAAGKLPHDLRKLWFEQQHLVLNQIGKYKTFPKGVKDKPRFPTFQSLKMESDIG